jgi:hypothetical protein
VRRLELRRSRASLATRVADAEPNAPHTPTQAPTPALAVLDLPPLPGAEDDERPLAAVVASPWRGAHHLYAGTGRTHRGSADQPAVMGELLWALWPGPVDRWDDGNRVRVKIYGGTLSSVTAAALLDGANVFAIESGDEWEIVQARNCELVVPNEYELSGFLRGQLGSAHAMAAPHPVGARIVKLDARLTRCAVGAHEWNEELIFVAPPAGALPSDARAATLMATLPNAAPGHGRPRICGRLAKAGAMWRSAGCDAPAWAATPGVRASRRWARRLKVTSWNSWTATR